MYDTYSHDYDPYGHDYDPYGHDYDPYYDSYGGDHYDHYDGYDGYDNYDSYDSYDSYEGDDHHHTNPFEMVVGMIEAHIYEHGAISKQEAKDLIQTLADAYNVTIDEHTWQGLEKLFDMVDISDDGTIDVAEIEETLPYIRGEKQLELPPMDKVMEFFETEFTKDEAASVTW